MKNYIIIKQYNHIFTVKKLWPTAQHSENVFNLSAGFGFDKDFVKTGSRAMPKEIITANYDFNYIDDQNSRPESLVNYISINSSLYTK